MFWDAKKQEIILSLRKEKCNELMKIGLFGIAKNPLDLETVAKYRDDIEKDILKYLTVQEDIFGGLKYYSITPQMMGFDMQVSQAIGICMYYILDLSKFGEKEKIEDKVFGIIFCDLGATKEDAHINTEVESYYDYHNWIEEELIKRL